MNIAAAVPTSAFTAVTSAVFATSAAIATTSAIAASQILFRATSYEELMAGLIRRRKALGYTQEHVNYISGLQEGYCNKLEAHMKGLGRLSLGLLLGALEVQLIAVAAPRTSSKKKPKPA
jgi:hypothetical protein